MVNILLKRMKGQVTHFELQKSDKALVFRIYKEFYRKTNKLENEHRYFTEEDIQMASKHMKRSCSSFFAIVTCKLKPQWKET